MRVLLIKMSSLGDVVHALPAVTDAAARGIEFDWVVEEAFAPIVERHPAVRRVLPIAWRRWRQSILSERSALKGFVRTLRDERYDLVLDAQGLFKSALVTALARAPVKAGMSYSSAREGVSAAFYNRRIRVPRDRHAIDRLRALFAGVFDYPEPETPVNFGLQAPSAGAGSNRCLLLHGTTWSSKHWPESMWRALAQQLAESGWQIELPWGDAQEQARAERIADGVEGVRVLQAMSLGELVGRIASSRLVIGVDSGLAHLSGACGVPTIVIYGSTSAALTGCRGAQTVNLQSDLGCAPCLERACRYGGEPLLWRDEVVTPACYARLTPEKVLEHAMKLLERLR